MARVLPVPAPARTHMGPWSVLATSRCSASRPPRIRSSSERPSGSGASAGGASPDVVPPDGSPPGMVLKFNFSVVAFAAQSVVGVLLIGAGGVSLYGAVSGSVRGVLNDAAVPVFNKGPGDGEPAGNDDLAAEDGVLQFAPAEPPCPGDLDAVGPGFGVRRGGREAEHQGGGKRPGLRSKVLGRGDADPDFLADFALHGLFERFPRFDEAGEGRIVPGVERSASAQQQSPVG